MNQEFSTNTEIPAEGFSIENSGVILLTPFLPALFKNLEWIKEGRISQFSSAVLAIHYAVTGHSKPGKNELLLPKLLCGLEMDFVLDEEVKLKDEEEQEINEMLRSVIQYWNALKNTSVQGLQETFLQRRGILTLQADRWLLQVEERTSDILLDYVSWNISMLKLPWMKGILRTDWR